MEFDEAQGEGYVKDSVKMIVESVDERLLITYAQLELDDIYHLTIEFIDRLSKHVGQTYNQICEDLKEIEESE